MRLWWWERRWRLWVAEWRHVLLLMNMLLLVLLHGPAASRLAAWNRLLTRLVVGLVACHGTSSRAHRLRTRSTGTVLGLGTNRTRGAWLVARRTRMRLVRNTPGIRGIGVARVAIAQ